MRILSIGVAAVAVAGGTVAMALAPTPAKFVGGAGASDKFEIDAARMMITSKTQRSRRSRTT